MFQLQIIQLFINIMKQIFANANNIVQRTDTYSERSNTYELSSKQAGILSGPFLNNVRYIKQNHSFHNNITQEEVCMQSKIQAC